MRQSSMRRGGMGIAVFLGLVATSWCEPLRLSVACGERGVRDALVSIPVSDLPTGWRQSESVAVKRSGSDDVQAAQLGGSRLWWVARGEMAPGEKRRYEVVAQGADGTLSIEKKEACVEIKRGDICLLRYHHQPVPPPDGVGKLFTRSGFIHPLCTPAGTPLTRIHPPDHHHHLGLWAPWTKTKFEGRTLDFWNLGKGQGTVRCKGVDVTANGPVFCEFVARQEHVDLKAPGGEKAALVEKLTVRVWDTGSPQTYGVDYTMELECAGESPLTIKAYRYQGLGFRGRHEWKNGNSDYLSSEGKNRSNGNATRARWCDVYGEVPEGEAGVLFMSSPQNRQHPEHLRIWPPNSMEGRGDVFLNFNPAQKQDWVLEPGKRYTLSYRMRVHEGRTTSGEAELLWNAFATPPAVSPEP